MIQPKLKSHLLGIFILFMIPLSVLAQYDRENCTLLGRWAAGRCYTVAAEGNIAYYGNGAYFEIADFADPAGPVLLSQTLLPKAVTGIAVDGDYAYVCNADSGLIILDISNPLSPERIGSVEIYGSAASVAVSGNYAYLADAWYGLRVINVSDPALPNEIASYTTFRAGQDVVVKGNHVYIAAGDSGLRVIDVSLPSQPREVAYVPSADRTRGVAVSGNYAYIADRNAGLHIIDISNPDQPADVGLLATGEANDVAVSGNTAFVADDWNGFPGNHIHVPYSNTRAVHQWFLKQYPSLDRLPQQERSRYRFEHLLQRVSSPKCVFQ